MNTRGLRFVRRSGKNRSVWRHPMIEGWATRSHTWQWPHLRLTTLHCVKPYEYSYSLIISGWEWTFSAMMRVWRQSRLIRVASRNCISSEVWFKQARFVCGTLEPKSSMQMFSRSVSGERLYCTRVEYIYTTGGIWNSYMLGGVHRRFLLICDAGISFLFLGILRCLSPSTGSPPRAILIRSMIMS